MSRIETIRAMLLKSPDDPFLHYSLGMELLATGEAGPASEAFQRAMELDPDDLAPYAQAARARQATGDRSGAIDVLRKGLSLAEHKGDSHSHDRLRMLLEALEPGEHRPPHPS